MAEVPAKGNILGKWLPARFKLAVLGSIGMGVIYGLKVNLSVALVGMLNHTAIITVDGQIISIGEEPTDNQLASIIDNSTDTIQVDGPYTWSEPLQGTLLSCYFWGYFISQIPGGRLAEIYSAKWIMFLSVIINIVCTILTPVMADLHYSAVIIMRVCEGIGGGMALPALYCMVGRWALPEERGRMTFMFYMGTALGSAKAYLTGTNMLRIFGWEYVFYVMGGLSCIWCVLWVILVQDSPQEQTYIDQKERDLIMKGLGITSYKKNKRLRMPWKSVFQSPAFLAILVAHTCSNWGWYMILLELPFYFKQVLKFTITENALLTSAPFITLWMFSLAFGRILNYLRIKNKITVTTSRQIGTSVASIVPSLCLLGLCYIGFYQSSAIALTAVGITSMAGMFCGFLSNHIDIAPNFAGTLMALTNTMATIPGIIVPVFVGYITEKNQTIHAWRIIFFVTIGFYIVEFVVYSMFGSGKEQSWNRLGSTKTEDQPLRQKQQLKA